MGCVSGSEIAGDISYRLGRTERNIKLHSIIAEVLSGPRISLPPVFLCSLLQA